MNLKTSYLGLELKNPLVVSSSPLSQDVENIRQMEDTGASALVLHSLFEEQIRIEAKELNDNLLQGTESFAEALSYFPDLHDYKLGPEEYLEHIRRVKESVEIPIFGSLNGVSSGGWIRYAKAIEEAGADGLELNIYFIPTNPSVMAGQVEQSYLTLVKDIKTRIKIPLAVKINPYFSSIPNLVQRIDQSGANALVLFNRFYQPDIDLESMEVVPNLVLSTSEELRLRLRWVAILFGHIQADMAITGGVHTAEDAVKSVMVGASAVMMTSALLVNGIVHLTSVIKGLTDWMDRNGYGSIKEMRGIMSQRSVAEPAAFERANYMKVLGSYR